MLLRDVSDKLEDKNCLTYTGAAEQADLAASCKRNKKIDNFNTGFQYSLRRILIYK